MNFDLVRWIPTILIVAMSGALAYFSVQNSEMEEAAPPAQLPLPPEAREYTPPASVRIPFEYDVFVSTLPPKVEVDESAVALSTGAAAKKGQKPGKDEPKIYINGIIWSPVTPLVSINGKILAEGGMLGKDVKVLKIMPNKVRLSVKGKIIDKRP